MNVEDVGVGFHRAENSASIATVALHDFGVEVGHLGLGGLHEGDGLLHHRWVLQVAEDAAKFLIEVVVLGGKARVQLVANGPYLSGFRHAASAHDHAVGPQQGELAHFIELVEIDFEQALHARGQVSRVAPAALEITAGETQ